MEPTSSEIRASLANQLKTLERYDFSEVRDQIADTEELKTANAAIAKYREYWRDVILGEQDETPSPSKLADIALHTHILLREDFAKFKEAVLGGDFDHLPQESQERRALELPVKEATLVSYLSSDTGFFRGDPERAQGALDAYLVKRAGGTCSKKLEEDAATTARLLKDDKLIRSGALDHDLSFLRRYLIQEGQAFQDKPKKAQEMIYSYFKFITNVGPDGGRPSPDIRSVWEAHQLHTENYEVFAHQYTSNPTYRPLRRKQ